jgi:hypothetical protein
MAARAGVLWRARSHCLPSPWVTSKKVLSNSFPNEDQESCTGQEEILLNLKIYKKFYFLFISILWFRKKNFFVSKMLLNCVLSQSEKFDKIFEIYKNLEI